MEKSLFKTLSLGAAILCICGDASKLSAADGGVTIKNQSGEAVKCEVVREEEGLWSTWDDVSLANKGRETFNLSNAWKKDVDAVHLLCSKENNWNISTPYKTLKEGKTYTFSVQKIDGGLQLNQE
jgi:hypothetical protein